MEKKWQEGVAFGEDNGGAERELIKFLNKHNLKPGEVIVLNSNLKGPIKFTYYAKKRLD